MNRRKQHGTRYTNKTATALKRGYLDGCTPMTPEVVSKLSMKDTYVDVYSGLRPWETPGGYGRWSVEENMCTMDRMNLEKGISKLKKMTDSRNISASADENDLGIPLTINVMRKKKEAEKKNKRKNKRVDPTDSKRRSPPRNIHVLSEKEYMIMENALIGKYHSKSTGKSLGEHAPIPDKRISLRRCQLQNIETLPSSRNMETFIFKARKGWKEYWVGKNILSLFLIQTKIVNLPLHGICARFSGISNDIEEENPIYLNVKIAYKLDRHGRYYTCIDLATKASKSFASYVVTLYEDGSEEYKNYSKYVSKYGCSDDVTGILQWFSSCYIEEKAPLLTYYTCSCRE